MIPADGTGLPTGMLPAVGSAAAMQAFPMTGLTPCMGAPLASPGVLPMASAAMQPGLTAAFGDPSQAALYHQILQQQMLQQQALVASQLAAASQAAQPIPDASEPREIHADIKELQGKYKLDDRIIRDLNTQMHKRMESFDDDMKAIREILGQARNPAGMLRVKLREMEDGSFRGTLTPDRDVEDLAKRFSLDAQAAAKLSEVLAKRDDRKKDLRQLAKHLELSNRPSSLVMLMLKDMRNGLPIKDPEYPPAFGSAAHKKGMKGSRRSKSRSRERKRRRDRSSSSSPPPAHLVSGGARPAAGKGAKGSCPRPQTLLERFG
eukprot:gb/GFBE01004826.1/.p1 GENE.gb/GFBE01004826.1/~~gb/GFBE01004826.1/.p1  ORF type:complete len:320 (+),score=59.73 gb/GFBE01004826.1/:1-960(+)